MNEKLSYKKILQHELKSMRAAHGFKYDGGEDGPRWYSRQGMKRSKAKHMAKLLRLLDMQKNGHAGIPALYMLDVDYRSTVRSSYLKEMYRLYKYNRAEHDKWMSES